MSHRSLSVLLALAALVLVPALCAAGALTHACDCGLEAECDHEASCAADPCVTPRTEDGASCELPPPDVAFVERAAAARPWRAPGRAVPPEAHGTPGAPCFAGAPRPLLL